MCSVYSDLLSISQNFPTHLVRMLSLEPHLSRLTPFFSDLTPILPLQRNFPHSTHTEVISLTNGAQLLVVTQQLNLTYLCLIFSLIGNIHALFNTPDHKCLVFLITIFNLHVHYLSYILLFLYFLPR